MRKMRLMRLEQQFADRQQLALQEFLARYSSLREYVGSLSEDTSDWTEQEKEAVWRWERIHELLDRAQQRMRQDRRE